MKAGTDEGLIDLADRARLTARRPLLVAHRGGAVGPGTPENSPAAMRLAAVHGYDLVELDVRQTKDGELFVFHGRAGNLLVDCGIDRTIQSLTRD